MEEREARSAATRKHERTIDRDGYVKVLWWALPRERREFVRKPKANHGRVLEHRLIAGEMVGRCLLPGESVHHRNGDRTDNRRENLIVMGKSAHSKSHKQVWKVMQENEELKRKMLSLALLFIRLEDHERVAEEEVLVVGGEGHG